MIISSSVGGNNSTVGTDSRKTQIRKKIKELETERRQLQKKLSKAVKSLGGGSSGASKSAKPVASTPAATTTQPATTTTATQKRHIPEAIRETMPNYDIQALAAEYSNPTMSTEAFTAGSALVQMTEKITGIYESSGETSEELDMTPEQIMEKLELIELQITMLQMRLGDDEKSVLSMGSLEDDDEQPETATPNVAATEANDEALSPPVVTDDGHVDGYA